MNFSFFQCVLHISHSPNACFTFLINPMRASHFSFSQCVLHISHSPNTCFTFLIIPMRASHFSFSQCVLHISHYPNACFTFLILLMRASYFSDLILLGLHALMILIKVWCIRLCTILYNFYPPRFLSSVQIFSQVPCPDPLLTCLFRLD